MKALDRASAHAPLCLNQYQHPANTWNDVSPEDKAEIHTQLEIMQGRRCAYCEGPLDSLGQHIEHFRRRRRFPHSTFDWNNLYWSCDQTDSCGHYKDNGAGTYNVADLIEPCIHDPDHYFRFRSDGTISIRSNLTEAESFRASETLRVFNLNPQWGRLRNMRKAAVTPYLSLVDGAAGFTGNELQDLLSDELESTKQGPFSTVIRHVLTEL
jgi:uncharacterized protein (TIGR02646 family)